MLFSEGHPQPIGFCKRGLTFILAEILKCHHEISIAMQSNFQENEQSHIFEIDKINICLATYFYINVTMMFL